LLAFACCLFGVTSYTLVSGHVPSLALLIASSFSIYGMLTKYMVSPSLQRMLFESVLGSVVVSVCLHQQCSLTNITTYGTSTAVLLLCSGLITALPGFLLIQSARNLPYSVVGILNYIVPSTIFCLGVFHFGELLSYPKLFMVGCIWIGVAIYFRCARPTSRA
jgi:chloramphenicol-sensitive protein RarD